MQKNSDNSNKENIVRQNKTDEQPAVTNNNNTKAAYKQAEQDIEQDVDLNNKPAPEDGLDEGELARLEGEK